MPSEPPVEPTVFRAASAGSTSGLGVDADLDTRDLLAARRRLLRAGLVVAATMIAYVVAFQTVWSSGATPVGRVVGVTSSVVFCALTAFVAWVPPSRGRLVAAGTLFQLTLGLGLALMEPFDVAQTDRPYTLISWNCVNILLVPVLVPASTRYLMGLAFALAALTPLGFIALAGQPGAPVLPLEVGMSLWAPPFVCALIVAAPSQLVSRLRRDLSRARRLGAYELVERLGRGGMGEVWRARHRFLKRPAAIKLVRPEILGEGLEARHRALVRFEREAQAIADLESPHTVSLYDFGVGEDGSFFYVMELLRGIDLQRLVELHGPVPPERAIHLLRQACHSLAEAHARGLVHRDIKPGNLFVGPRGRDDDVVRVLDFGLVKSRRPDDPDATGPRSDAPIQGTPSTIAPEAALGTTEVDGRADLYALGCVAFFLVTGRKVFEADSAMQMVVAHVSEPPPPPSARTEQVLPEALDDVVLACLAKDPAARPPTAEALAARLAAIEGLVPWTAERARSWWATHEPAVLADADPA
ncbi:MAG: serine/threonine-protein kinase [Sandaracinaceae bacterium]